MCMKTGGVSCTIGSSIRREQCLSLGSLPPSTLIVVLHGQVFPGDLRECRASRLPVDVADGQARRRGSRTDVSSILSRIHELADHLQKHVSTRRLVHEFLLATSSLVCCGPKKNDLIRYVRC